jgi:hypothetical protein
VTPFLNLRASGLSPAKEDAATRRIAGTSHFTLLLLLKLELGVYCMDFSIKY